MRRVVNCEICYSDQINEDEMGGARSMHTKLCLNYLNGINRLRDVSTDKGKVVPVLN